MYRMLVRGCGIFKPDERRKTIIHTLSVKISYTLCHVGVSECKNTSPAITQIGYPNSFGLSIFRGPLGLRCMPLLTPD